MTADNFIDSSCGSPVRYSNVDNFVTTIQTNDVFRISTIKSKINGVTEVRFFNGEKQQKFEV